MEYFTFHVVLTVTSQKECLQHHCVNFQLMSCATIGQVYRRVLFHIGEGYENLHLHWWCDRNIDKQPMHALLNSLNLPEDVDISARCTQSCRNRSRFGILSSTINDHNTSSQLGTGTFRNIRTLTRQQQKRNVKRSYDSLQRNVTNRSSPMSLSFNHTINHSVQDPTSVAADLSNKANRTSLEGTSKKVSFDTGQDNRTTLLKQFATITQQHSEEDAPSISNISRASDSNEYIQNNEDHSNEFLMRFSETSEVQQTSTKSQTPTSVKKVRAETTPVHNMSIEMARDNTATAAHQLDDSIISEARDFDYMMETKRQAKSPGKQELDSQSLLNENTMESPDLSRVQSLSKDSNPHVESIVRSYLKKFFNESENSRPERRSSSLLQDRKRSSNFNSDMNHLNDGSQNAMLSLGGNSNATECSNPDINLSTGSQKKVKQNRSTNGNEDLYFSATNVAAGESPGHENSHILSLLNETSSDDQPTSSKEPLKSPKSFSSNSTQAKQLFRQNKVDKNEIPSTSKIKRDSNQNLIHDETKKSNITSAKMKTYLLPDSFCGEHSPDITPRNASVFDQSTDGIEVDNSVSLETARNADNFILPDPTRIHGGHFQNVTKRRKNESSDFNIRDLLPPPPRYDELPVTHEQINSTIDPILPEVIDFINTGKPARDIPRQSTAKSPIQQQPTKLGLSPIKATSSKKQLPKYSRNLFQSSNKAPLSGLNPIVEDMMNSDAIERNASFIPPGTPQHENRFVPDNMASSQTTQIKPRTLCSLRRTYTQASSHPSYIEIMADVSEYVFETLDEISNEMQHEIGKEPFSIEEEFLLSKLVECMGSDTQWDHLLYAGWNEFGNRRSTEDLRIHYDKMVRENSNILNRVKRLFQSQ